MEGGLREEEEDEDPEEEAGTTEAAFSPAARSGDERSEGVAGVPRTGGEAALPRGEAAAEEEETTLVMMAATSDGRRGTVGRATVDSAFLEDGGVGISGTS